MTLKVFPLRGEYHSFRYFSCLRRPRAISLHGLGLEFIPLWKHLRPVAVTPSVSPGHSWNTLDSWSSFVFKQLSTKMAPGCVLGGIPGGWISQGCTTPMPGVMSTWDVRGTCSACFSQPLCLSPVSRDHKFCPGQACGSFNSSWLKFRGKSRLRVNEALAGSYKTTFPLEQKCHCHPMDESCHHLQLCSECLNTCSLSVSQVGCSRQL